MLATSSEDGLQRPQRAWRINSSRTLSLLVGGLGGVLIFLALAQLALSVSVVRQRNEVDFGEAILYDHASRLVRGEPLYQPLDRPPYTVVAYTPLYYALAAVLRVLVGPGFGPGRVLSIVSGLAAAALVGYLAAHLVRDRRAGVFAGLLFVTLGFPGPFAPWFALYKEDALGVALSLAAVTLLIRPEGRVRLVGSGALSALAILTKQPFAVAALALTIWLWYRNRKASATFTITWLMIVGLTVTALEASSQAFIANAIVANAVPFSGVAFAVNLPALVRFQGGLLAVAVLYLLRPANWPRCPASSLVAWLWLASASWLVGLAAIGSNRNYWIPLAAADAALATVALWLSVRRVRTGGVKSRTYPQTILAFAPLLLLSANIIAVVPPLGRGDFLELTRPKPGDTEAFSRLVEQVRLEPREVMANPLDVIVLAGRRVTFEPHFFTILGRQGAWDPDPVVRRICRGEVGLLVLEQPLESGAGGYQGYAHWPTMMLAAFRETMALEGRLAGRSLYVPATHQLETSAAPTGVCQAALAPLR